MYDTPIGMATRRCILHLGNSTKNSFSILLFNLFLKGIEIGGKNYSDSAVCILRRGMPTRRRILQRGMAIRPLLIYAGQYLLDPFHSIISIVP